MMSPLTVVKGDYFTALTPAGIIRCGGVHDPDMDINERGPRLSERNGIILKPDMIAANALDYLCDEIRHAFPDVAAPWP